MEFVSSSKSASFVVENILFDPINIVSNTSKNIRTVPEGESDIITLCTELVIIIIIIFINIIILVSIIIIIIREGASPLIEGSPASNALYNELVLVIRVLEKQGVEKRGPFSN